MQIISCVFKVYNGINLFILYLNERKTKFTPFIHRYVNVKQIKYKSQYHNERFVDIISNHHH